ncbi:hypothetical protein B9G69_002545 [Bdellovibrio sp. SKB1291214]|uniref:hypothetical protein n=1 Tax=Bdellovibrio sp. SKB1291214 TaxID=1732569 RepID=UPI000B51C051|nr:hypothetical protein [Bdellovibrio sp. SKB1291214]UYL09450.1 hypothetical protein B9G69_002545 [Bdellovibrio sp. SKB1291214]
MSIFFLLLAQNVTAAPACEKVFIPSKQELLIQEFSKGSKDFLVARKLAKNIQNKSSEEQLAELKDIGAIYREVPKKDPNPLAAWHIGGRRLLDYALALVQRHDIKFAQGHSAGKSGKELYQDFLSEQKQLFGTRYEVQEVIRYAEYLQSQLPALQASMNGGPALQIILGGSFINGKARLETSDLDISVNQPALKKMKAAWELNFNEVLKEKHSDANMTLEMHGEPAAFYGKINPVVIVITADKIHLQVFEPAQISTRPSELKPGSSASYPL